MQDPKTQTSAQGGLRPEQSGALFDRLLTRGLSVGESGFRLRPGQPVQTLRAGVLTPHPEQVLPADVLTLFVSHLIALDQHKPIDEVDEADHRRESGRTFFYDVVLPGPEGRQVVRTLRMVFEWRQGIVRLDGDCEPAFLAGYPRCVDPGAAPTDGDLARWLDDFITRMFAASPRPKDIVLSPNRSHPFVTVTGGLRAVEDVLLSGGGRLTERIAQVLVKEAANPLVDQEIAANGGGLRRLDLDLAYKTRAGRRLRVNIADTFDVDNDHGPLITMRLLPERPWTLEQLPLPRQVLDTCLTTRMGLILICGTTGSGKSTTMCVIIDHLLKSRSINFLTIENPIETMFPARDYPRSIISQRELGKHTSSSHRGMESAVRQTLNMAMVGEIRNARDALMALELAQSGHLIFATVHAGSVGESIRRVVDMFPPDQEGKIREMLATHYRMGLAQILVKGTSGQTELVLEVMRTNADIQTLILDKQPPERQLVMREMLEIYGRHGCRSLDQALVELFKAGRITEDTLMFNSPDPAALVHRQLKLGVKLSSRWDPTGALIEQDMGDRLVLQPVDLR